MAKVCCLCGADVSGQKRVKDAAGHYYCEVCYRARAAELQRRAPAKPTSAAATPVPSSTVATGAGQAAVPPAARVDDGMLELSERAAPVAAMLACADCKKLIPEKQARNDDGEFLCPPCFAKRRQQARRPTPPPVARGRHAQEEEPAAPSAASSAGLVFLTAAVTILTSWFLLTGLILAAGGKEVGVKGALAIGAAAMAGGMLTVICIVQAVALLGAMLLTGRIFGGLEFGTLNGVIWKSMLVIVLGWVGNFASDLLGETFSALMFVWGPGVSLLGLVLLFKLDFLEAIVLSVINWGMSFVAMIVAGIAVPMILGLFAGHAADEDERDWPPPPAEIQQAGPGHAATQGAATQGAPAKLPDGGAE